MTAAAQAGFRSLMNRRAARLVSQPVPGSSGSTLQEWRASAGAGRVVADVRPNPGRSLAVMDAIFSLAIDAPANADLAPYDPEFEEREATRVAVARGELDDVALHPVAVAMDVLAFYASPHDISPVQWMMDDVDPDWGIFLTTGGIEHLAREVYLPIGLDLPAALRAAAGALYRHELFHHLVAVAASALEVRDETELYVPFRESTSARDGYSLTEEGLANAFSVRLAEREKERQALLDWTRSAPPGYRDAARLVEDFEYRSAGRQLVADLRGVPKAAVGLEDRLLLDLGLQEVDPGEVPLHIVESPGSAHEDRMWRWGTP